MWCSMIHYLCMCKDGQSTECSTREALRGRRSASQMFGQVRRSHLTLASQHGKVPARVALCVVFADEAIVPREQGLAQ